MGFFVYKRDRCIDGYYCVNFVMKRLCTTIILFSCFSYSQTNITNFQFPSDATTDSIKAVVSEMLDAISNNDSTRAAKVVVREGHVMVVFKKLDKTTINFRTNNLFIERTGKRENNVHERMWNPIILYRGDLAVAWTTYDFHKEGQFSHCGAETFNLVRIDNQWLVSDWAFTVEPNNCEESPLGAYTNN